MRPWQLLVSLLMSDLSLLGDGDWIMDYFSRPSGRKLLLCREKSHGKPLKVLLTHAGLQGGCACVAVQHQHNDHGHSRQDMTGVIDNHQLPGQLCSLQSVLMEGNHVPVSLVESNTQSAAHVTSETSHVTMDVPKNSPASTFARLYHHFSALGGNFSTVLLERSKAVDVQPEKAVTVTCCPVDSEIQSTLRGEQHAMDVKDPKQHDGWRSTISQLDIVHSASMKISDGVQKTDELLNLGEDKKQLPLYAASSERKEGSFAQKQLVLASRENKGPINRPRYVIRPAREHNNEYFSGKIITQEFESTRLEGEREPKRSHRNGVEKKTQKSSANILQTQTDNVSLKPALCEVGEEALMVLFLPDAETQTEPSNERNLAPNTDTKCKSVNILLKELDDPPPITETVKGCKVAGSQCSLEINAADRNQRIDIKPAKETEHAKTDNTPQKNVSRKPTQEENKPSEESVIPASVTPTATHTEASTEATAANTEVQEPTSAETFSQTGAGGADGGTSSDENPMTIMNPEPASNYEPGLIQHIPEITETTTPASLSGLRMREDIQDFMDELQRDTEKDRTTTSWTVTEREGDQNNPGVVALKPLEAVHGEDTNTSLKPTGDSVPPCGGLIQRTDAGWKYCTDRRRLLTSKTVLFREVPDAAEAGKEPAGNSAASPPTDDENDHFYYFNGVLKRVQNNLYPQYKRQRRRSLGNIEKAVTTEKEKEDEGIPGNLLNYIQRLNERNKDTHLK